MHIWRLMHCMCVIVMFLSCVWLYYCWIFKHYFILFCILSKCSSVAPGHFQLTEMELITMMEGHYYCFMFFNAKKQIEWVIWTTRRNKKKNMFRQNWVQYSGYPTINVHHITFKPTDWKIHQVVLKHRMKVWELKCLKLPYYKHSIFFP